MPLRQRKRLRMPGLAEVIAVLLTVATIVPAVLWIRSAVAGSWDIAAGEVVSARIYHTHYNAEDTRLKVDCEYEFVVGQTSYRGSWSGFWPYGESPNALPRDELDALRPGYPISVYYNGSNPRQSNPHAPGGRGPVVYAWVSALSFLLTAYYCFRIYPALRIA